MTQTVEVCPSSRYTTSTWSFNPLYPSETAADCTVQLCAGTDRSRCSDVYVNPNPGAYGETVLEFTTEPEEEEIDVSVILDCPINESGLTSYNVIDAWVSELTLP